MEPEERRAERRRQLLDSALELFATTGYANTSIEQICQYAFVGFKGFYDEFKTKEHLFLSLYESLLEQVAAQVLERATQLDPAEDGLHALLLSFVHAVVDDRRVAQVLLVESAGLSPSVEVRRRAVHNGFAWFIESSYTSGQLGEAHLRGPLDPRKISLGTVGGIAEVIVAWLVDPDPDAVEELVADLEVYCRVVMAGLGVRRG
jgi:AcrR family transcriptional regulator